MKKLLFAITFLVGILTGNAATINHSFDVRTASNVEAQTLDNHLKGVLTGKGKYFKEAEEKYNVNAVFLAAIAIYESGNGTSSRARNKKNCFGLHKCRFNTVDESIHYTAKLISSPTGYYYGRKKFTISHIGRIYAPTWHCRGNSRWVPSVVSIMKKIMASAN